MAGTAAFPMLLLSSFLWTAKAHAQPPARPDPLGPLVEEAIRANLALEGERLAERRAADEVEEAIGLWLPRIDLESRISEVDGVQNLGDLINPAYQALNELTGTSAFPTDIDLALPREHETRVRLTQPLFAEALRANVSLQRAEHDAQRSQFAASARQIAALAQIAYLQEASARRVVEIQEAALAIVRENERAAERLRAAGSANPEAVHRARADRADVEQQLAEARERRIAAQRELNRILQRALDAPVDVIADEALDFPLELDADAAVAHALAHREELRAGSAGIRAAEAARRAVTARFLPNVSFAFDYGFQGSEIGFREDEDYWMASLVAQWNLFDLGRHAARSAATHDIQRAEVGKRDVQSRIEVEVRTAHEATTVAHAAIATADTRLEASRRAFELVRRRYEEGAASPLELVDARGAYTSAELNRVLTAYRYAMRWVDLERAAALRTLGSLEERNER